MRLFVAVDVGERIARSAADIIGQLRRRIGQQAPHARVAWIPPERMHVTVRFIGDVPEARLPTLRAALESPLDLAPFETEFAGLGVFATRGRPRVIWVGVGAGVKEFRDLERLLAGRLDPLIGPSEEREYTPHLTLGRVKDAAGLTRRICDGFEDLTLGTTTVAAVTLFESRPSANGPTYVPVAAAPLRDDFDLHTVIR